MGVSRSSVGSLLRVRIRGGSNFAGYSETGTQQTGSTFWRRNAARRSNCWRMPQPVWQGCASSSAACHPTALDVQVAELKAKLAVVEAERDARDAQRQCGIHPVVDPDSQDPVPTCRREEFIPNCDEEMQEWMEDRHKDFQEAMVAGRLRSPLVDEGRTGEPFWLKVAILYAQGEVHVELFLLFALLRLMSNRRGRIQEGMAARCRPWPVVVAADFEGSSPSGEVAHCRKETRWWRCKSPSTDPSRPAHTSFAGAL